MENRIIYDFPKTYKVMSFRLTWGGEYVDYEGDKREGRFTAYEETVNSEFEEARLFESLGLMDKVERVK